MDNYKFKTDEIGISDTGIHLLRSNFNYKTIDYTDIKSLMIEKGKLINNWILVLLMGLGLIAFSIYVVIGLVEDFNDLSVRVIYVERFVIPVLPFMLGLYCIYNALKTGLVIKTIEGNGKHSSFPLTVIIKNKELDALVSYLKTNKLVNSKLSIYISA